MPLSKALRLFLIGLLLLGCTQSQKRGCKHMVSDFSGLRRTITLYAGDGKVIQQWSTRAKVEIDGAIISFLDDHGKDVKLMGTVTVIEK